MIDLGQKADTGMTAGEAFKKAEAWWTHNGRHLMKDANSRKDGKAFASTDPDSPNALPSGIFRGLPWSELTFREQVQIRDTVHHFATRRPDLLEIDPEKPWLIGRGEP